MSAQDFKHLKEDRNWLDKGDLVAILPKDETFKSLPVAFQESILNWSDKGYAILDGYFSPSQIDALNQSVDLLVKSSKADWRNGNKIMFAIHQSKTLFEIGSDSDLAAILALLLGKPVDLFQSINFLTCSQQRTHSNAVYMSTFSKGNMIACCIA